MTTSITYRQKKNIDKQSLLDLYIDAGWTAYTKDPKTLFNGIENSYYVLSAWDKKKLVGLLRVVSDGYTILYIQDILVLKKYKRQGIGTTLINKTLKKFINVRIKLLLTEDNKETRGFYESLGFESCDKGQLVSFIYKENN